MNNKGWMWNTSNNSTSDILGKLRQFNENRRRFGVVNTLRSSEFGHFWICRMHYFRQHISFLKLH